MRSVLIDKFLKIMRETAVIQVANSHIENLPSGAIVRVKGEHSLNPRMLIASWHDKEFLIFEQDLCDVKVLAEAHENVIALAVGATTK